MSSPETSPPLITVDSIPPGRVGQSVDMIPPPPGRYTPPTTEQEAYVPPVVPPMPSADSETAYTPTAAQRAEEQAAKERRADLDAVLAEKKRGRRRGMAKVALSALALYGTLSSGGALDKAIDPFQDAQTVVYDAIPEPGYRSTGGEVTPELADELNAEAAQARDRIAQTMSDLDSHSYGAIQERATQFAAAHPEQIMNPEQVSAFKERISAADSNEEVMTILNEFTGLIDIKAQFATSDFGDFASFDTEKTATADTKRAANTIVGAVSRVPKDVMREAHINTIHLANTGKASKLGQYMPVTGDIVVAIHGTPSEILDEAFNKLPKSDWLLASDEWVMLHEIGHGFQGAAFGTLEQGGASEGIEHMARDLFQRADHTSVYGAGADENERQADIFAAVFSGDQLGLAHPDEARRFSSGANEKVLKFMNELELEYPGIIDYVIANNDRLMNRTPVSIGR